VIQDNLAAGRDVRYSAAIVASWARYAEGMDEAGEPITVVDVLATELTKQARRYHEDELSFIRNRNLFGELSDDAHFAEPYLLSLKGLHEEGSLNSLRSLLERP
jgi:mannitol 2-dehydrogenase